MTAHPPYPSPLTNQQAPADQVDSRTVLPLVEQQLAPATGVALLLT